MALTLKQITKPFNIIHNEPEFVRNKFLEGEPYKNNNSHLGKL